MRKVNLSMNEREKYLIIKSLVDHTGNKKKAAIVLGCTTRTVNLMIQVYQLKVQ
ncbi:helix-turn-helix domain-containing protein [Erysipelothrix aquatica]|uniref:helix-turn-helix domain-containing protein n=1 Tax=Erysipelothrix aquatica TaxID=2683714 RepID=UPI0013573BD0|nr:hypothetical protein [Erysipelothrix aquatica]